MIRKTAAFFLIAAMLMGISACGSQAKVRYEAEFLGVFDTLTKIVAYTDSKEKFTGYSQLIHDKLKEYNDLYDIYHDYPGINNIKTINDNAGIKPVKVDKRIIDLLLFAREWCKKSNGRKNIAMGAVLSIWHDYREAGIADEADAKLPPMAKLKEAAAHTDIDKMIINQADSTVYLEDPKMSLDVGSVAKGYSVEQVCRIAEKAGFTSALISVGGNIRAIGSKGVDGQLWNVGIQNPDTDSPNKTLKIVYLKDMSLVTSGDYERYYTVNGKRYHHIINPDTLFPTEYFHSVTVLTKDSGIADGLTTILFNMTYEKGLEFLKSLPGTEALWVMKNGEIKYTDGFQKYLKK